MKEGKDSTMQYMGRGVPGKENSCAYTLKLENNKETTMVDVSFFFCLN